MSAPTISTEDVIAQYQSVSDFAALYILEAFMCSLSYGPVLILSIIALKRLRKRLSFTPSRSSKWLFGIILSQLIFVTLRSVCSTGLYVADFKDNHFVVLDDGSVQQLFDNSLLTVELVFICCGAVSTRAMEVLASAVLVWRAFTIYSDIFWIRFILILAWVIDFAVAAFHVGVYMQVNIGIAMYRPDVSMQLVPIALYASRWMSFALNALVTALIAYRAWKFKNVLQDAGLRTKRSMSYQILARLVETGVLLLAVQLLVAILATTYHSLDPADPGYIAMIVFAELALIVINAHPAAMSLVSSMITSQEDRTSRDVESVCVSSNMAFRVTDTRLSTTDNQTSVLSVPAEK